MYKYLLFSSMFFFTIFGVYAEQLYNIFDINNQSYWYGRENGVIQFMDGMEGKHIQKTKKISTIPKIGPIPSIKNLEYHIPENKRVPSGWDTERSIPKTNDFLQSFITKMGGNKNFLFFLGKNQNIPRFHRESIPSQYIPSANIAGSIYWCSEDELQVSGDSWNPFYAPCMWEKKPDMFLNTYTTKKIEILNSSEKEDITFRIYPIDPSQYQHNLQEGTQQPRLIFIDPILEYHDINIAPLSGPKGHMLQKGPMIKKYQLEKYEDSVYIWYPYYEFSFACYGCNFTDDGNFILDLSYYSYTPLYENTYYISE